MSLPFFQYCKNCKHRNEKNYFFHLEHIFYTNRNEIDILLILNNIGYNKHKNENYLEFPNDNYCIDYNENCIPSLLLSTFCTQNNGSIPSNFQACIYCKNRNGKNYFYFHLRTFCTFHNENNIIKDLLILNLI